MNRRRFGLLIGAVALATVFLWARMAQVQVVEHDLWAREAANLLRTSTTLPYHRGRILDRRERVLVEDTDTYSVELVYRTFRRNHPLGQVTHGRSALLMSAVSLQSTAGRLVDHALELVSLTPAQLEAFRRGASLTLEPSGLVLPAEDPERARRAGRAAEVGFYLRNLLGLSQREWTRMRKEAEQGAAAQRSWLALAAELRGRSLKEFQSELVDRLEGGLVRLGRLAWLAPAEEGAQGESDTEAEALGRLLEGMQRIREGIEAAIAEALFREAAGFGPGRVGTSALEAHFDLGWIAESLRWSDARLELWVAGLRTDWERNWTQFFVPGAAIRARFAGGGEGAGERLTRSLAALYRAPTDAASARSERDDDWRGVDRLIVFDELPTLFELSDPPVAVRAADVLPFQSAALRARGDADPWALLGAMVGEPDERLARALAEEDSARPWTPPEGPLDAAVRLQRVGVGAPSVDAGQADDRRKLPVWIVGGWERRFQERLAERLALVSAAAPDGAVLPFAAARMERARDQAAYIIRDRGSRAVVVSERPSFEIVLMLTRYPEHFRGFRVRDTTRRRAVATDEQGQAVASHLVGRVREASLAEVVGQTPRRRELFDLRHKTLRSEADRKAMGDLVAHLFRNDELHGASGVEGLFDPALRGENGYLEREGLEERDGSESAGFFQPPVDGRDVVLTLDLDLQAAAQRAITHPILPDHERERDEVWFDHPVGAIVLITPDGAVLAAASAPALSGGDRVAGRDGQRAWAHERTLRRFTFQPVGSVFKPFVAAYALDRLALDPTAEHLCEVREGTDWASWGHVRCHARWGHGALDLHEALVRSCNAYFARLGSTYPDGAALLEMAETFGFHRPTGVRAVGARSGLAEDSAMPAFAEGRPLARADLQRGANGLSVIEATPMQVARATAALATGRLCDLRLVASVGGRPLAVVERPLDLSFEALETVRGAMVDVVRRGTASGRGLGVAHLGFRLAAKTGSADYAAMNDVMAASLRGTKRPEMRKHAWLAGWFPADDPVAVLVVYLHDVGFTSSHTAVHVASQFLRSAEVGALVMEGRR
ncbi:MAG TPA: penicillin-binding transpeptidase domain-containing protein [Planctomycetota bacterium]|nr:penicillin-binding transpeptidase domain-containing protein [Planctomycetota bacterium]